MPQCSTCAFLGRFNGKDGVWEEPVPGTPPVWLYEPQADTNSELREIKHRERTRQKDELTTFDWPGCLMGREEIYAPAGRAYAEKTDIWWKHDCPEHTQYLPGYTPRRALEARQEHIALNLQRDWQAKEGSRQRRTILAGAALSASIGGAIAILASLLD